MGCTSEHALEIEDSVTIQRKTLDERQTKDFIQWLGQLEESFRTIKKDNNLDDKMLQEGGYRVEIAVQDAQTGGSVCEQLFSLQEQNTTDALAKWLENLQQGIVQMEETVSFLDDEIVVKEGDCWHEDAEMYFIL